MFRRLGLSIAAVMAGTAISGIATMTPTAAASPAPAVAEAPATPAAPAARTAPAAAKVANVAHRGASAYAPENTIAAFKLAKAQRADIFELDVHQTKDHQLILMHDTTLARTTNVESVFPGRAPYKVSSFTLNEIRKLDAGSWFGKKYKGERVPTLGESLRAMRGSGLGMLLEVKAPHLYPGIERRIAAELRRHTSWLRPDPTERLLAVQSFDFNSMRRFHELMPQVPIGLLGTPDSDDLPELASFADQINPRYADVTAAYVKRVHRLNMDVFTWTIDDAATMRRVIGLGVDGVITNKPDVLHRVLNKGDSRLAAA